MNFLGKNFLIEEKIVSKMNYKPISVSIP